MCSNPEGTVLLVRPKRSLGMARLVKLECEPLELEYLSAVAESAGWRSEIYDGAVCRESFRSALKRLRPDVVAFSGYFPAESAIIRHAQFAKRVLPETVVVVGGVHAQLNHERFHQPGIDLVVRADGLSTFRSLLVSGTEAAVQLPGVCHVDGSDRWVCNAIGPEQPLVGIRPSRTHFEKYRRRFRYLGYGPTAVVKGSYGCPYNCSFCYCRLLNGGKYHARPLDDVLDEISGISADTIWIVDDIFLLERQQVLEFCSEVERRGLRRKFIVYGRADFIAKNADLLPAMKAAGIIDVIVGLEAIDAASLLDYRKQVSAEENEDCVRLLQEAGIKCTGLFIVSHNATRADFRALDRWISRTGLRVYTMSIFSPFPGTEGYQQYRDQLTTEDCRKWDLLHLVIEPGGMSRLEFYLRFYWLQAKMLFRPKRKRVAGHAAEMSPAVRQVAS